jgi:hypothetical protein
VTGVQTCALPIYYPIAERIVYQIEERKPWVTPDDFGDTKIIGNRAQLIPLEIPWWEQPDAHDKTRKFHKRMLLTVGGIVGLGLAGNGIHKLNQWMNKPPKMNIDWPRLYADEEKNLLEGGPRKTGSARTDKERELYRIHGFYAKDYWDQVKAIEPGNLSVYIKEEMDAYRTSPVPLMGDE